MTLARAKVQVARLQDGREFHYVEEGEGEPLVFIHGLTGDYGSWGAQWPAFSSRFRAISYSRRFSRPNRNDPALSLDHSAAVDARDLSDLLTVWGAPSAVLVGSSYGAYTALALAIDQPHRVSALVLSEPPVLAWADRVPGGRTLRERFEREVVEPARDAFERGDDARGASLYASGALGEGALAGLPAAVYERRIGNTEAVKVLAASRQAYPALDAARAGALSVPTLLLSGQNTQPIFAAVFEALRALMPGAEAHRVPHSGHSVYREQPERFNALALEFLERRLALQLRRNASPP